MTPKKAMDVLEFHKNWKVMCPVQICTCEFVSTVAYTVVCFPCSSSTHFDFGNKAEKL
jgi:hypothetical protein